MNSTSKQEFACNDTIAVTPTKLEKKECCGIYGLKCKANNKWYVGQSANIPRRLKYYERLLCKKQPKIYHALLKYGYGEFDVVILETCENNKSIMDEKEREWIARYDSIDKGYNTRQGGTSGRHSKESVKKIAAYRLGKKWSDDERKKISDGNRRAQASEEYKKKISDSWKLRRIAGVSAETKEKMRNAKLNQSAETRAKIAEANRGRKQSGSTRFKISEARKLYWQRKKLDESRL